MRVMFRANNPTMGALFDVEPAQELTPAQTAAATGMVFAGGAIATALMTIGAAYFWKSAPKMQGFWKGYGYFSAVLGTMGAAAYGVATLTGTAMVPFLARKSA